MSCHPASSVQAGPHLAVSENQKAGVYMSPQHSVCCSLLFLLTFVCWQGHSSTVSPGGHCAVSGAERSWLCPDKSPSCCPATMFPYCSRAQMWHECVAGDMANRFRPPGMGMGEDCQEEHRAETSGALVTSQVGLSRITQASHAGLCNRSTGFL